MTVTWMTVMTGAVMGIETVWTVGIGMAAVDVTGTAVIAIHLVEIVPVVVVIGMVGLLIVIPKMDMGRNEATIGTADQGVEVAAATGTEVVVRLRGTRVEGATGRDPALTIGLAGLGVHLHLMIATDAQMPGILGKRT